jgi:hypothetical protein
VASDTLVSDRFKLIVSYLKYCQSETECGLRFESHINVIHMDYQYHFIFSNKIDLFHINKLLLDFFIEKIYYKECAIYELILLNTSIISSFQNLEPYS